MISSQPINIDYRVDYSDKRKSVAIVVERNGDVVVKAPDGYSKEKIARIIDSKKLFIYSKINHPQKIKVPRVNPVQIHGRTVLYMGKNQKAYIDQLTENEFNYNGRFIISVNIKDQFDRLLKQWYIEKATEKLVPRVIYYATRLGVEYNKIMISDLQLRWGSCTPKNNINLNYRLIKAPAFVYNYIIVHELAHLLVSNHTPEFWQKVRTCFSRYDEARKWLKAHGDKLFVE